MAVTGNLYPFIQQQAARVQPALSFLQAQYTDVDAWREEACAYLYSRLLYHPEACALEPELVDQVEYPDYFQQKWYITSSPGDRIPVILLVPRLALGPSPAIVALHGHGGMYYYGKKQLLEDENEPALLRQFRQDHYAGASIAADLAREGYVVAVIDAFYFGERRIDMPIPAEMEADFLLAAEGSDPWLGLLNRISSQMESTVAKSLFLAGATWPGVLAWDDLRTVEFLCARPEVDAARLGCVGLGMGGFRAALLGALDRRVAATCIVGWMSTFSAMLEAHIPCHAWPAFIPGLSRGLDWPDVAALHAPHPLLIMQGSHDPQFPLEGYQCAAEQLRSIYAKAGAPGNMDIGLFDVEHTFSAEMQRQAWAFFSNVLQAS